MTIFVGNLNRSVREEELQNLFSTYGEVKQVKIIKDNYTGESKGFAFVDMNEDTKATQAIDGLNETEFSGRKLAVNEARPRTESARPGNGGYNRGKY